MTNTRKETYSSTTLKLKKIFSVIVDIMDLKFLVTGMIVCTTISKNLSQQCDEWIDVRSEFLIDYVEWRKISYLIILDEELKQGNKGKIIIWELLSAFCTNCRWNFVIPIENVKKLICYKKGFLKKNVDLLVSEINKIKHGNN